uniref:Protein kinase domain-containing protein n=1 Tax=Arcella intermedia TaxID=1963864 RepID=A0A6B2L323_9EUKA
MEAFRTECQVLKNIVSHPNLLLFMGACLEEGKYKLVLEWAPNGSLESLANQDQQLSFKRKIISLNEICTGMNWLHDRQEEILHLQLNPSNILFSASMQVKIANYGSGKTVKDWNNPVYLQNKAVFYVAPELLQDPSKPSRACDVYSFGILAYHILTEKQPYNAVSLSKFKEEVINGSRPIMPQGTPQKLKEILESCWDKNTERRPSFKVLASEDWQKLISDTMSKNQKATEEMWLSLSKVPNQVPKSVPWLDFVKGFSTFLGVTTPKDTKLEETTPWKCIQYLLEAKSGTVTVENWNKFLGLFGPVTPGTVQGTAFLKHIVTLLQQDWFHGAIGGKEAENRINIDPNSKNASVFLLRFSDTSPTFTLTSRKKPSRSAPTEIKHERLTKESWTDIPSLIQYIEKEKKKRHLTACTHKRAYEDIFKKQQTVVTSVYEVHSSVLKKD